MLCQADKSWIIVMLSTDSEVGVNERNSQWSSKPLSRHSYPNLPEAGFRCCWGPERSSGIRNLDDKQKQELQVAL